jgi:hypothetical protein
MMKLQINTYNTKKVLFAWMEVRALPVVLVFVSFDCQVSGVETCSIYFSTPK